MPVERLQKVLARAGVASRRKCEEMIAAGRVRVNGQTVCEPGTQINAESDGVEVDGQPLARSTPRVYWLVNKPVGYLSTVRDPRGRPTVLDLVGSQERLYPVGRLDLDSEGLILLTNDGELAQRLTHPSFEHEKEYRVWVDGLPTQLSLQRLREGVELEGGFTWPAEVQVLREEQGGAWLRFVIHEGRKRQLRRMCEAVGHTARRLIRVRMGPLSLGDLPMGESRALTQAELRALKKAVIL